MSLGWKKFSFFTREEKPESTLSPDVCCSCCGVGEVYFGCKNGIVTCVDRALRTQRSFQAHASQLYAVHASKTNPFLVTVGNDIEDEASASARVWNLEGGQSSEPTIVRSVRLFSSKVPEGPITVAAVQEEGWPTVSIAYAVGNGGIYVLKGDLVRERVTRQVLFPQEDNGMPTTVLQYAGPSSSPLLYAVSKSQTCVINTATGQKVVLDDSGAKPHCGVVSPTAQLVVGRQEAVYFYTTDGRGPCFVFEGKKDLVAWVQHSLVVVSSPLNDFGSSSMSQSLQVYDMRNKLVAATLPVEGVLQVVAAFGVVLVVDNGGKLSVLKEKELSSKLDLLFSKNLYIIALNLASMEQADASVLSDIHRRYGDHLYNKHDYDGAVLQYIATVGHLEASYVIRKFLDAQRIHNLTLYLESLHDQGCANADHTTLLLNCYTKLKDMDKLDKFIRREDGKGNPVLSFDIDTAIKVLRSAGYYSHALYVAGSAADHHVYLDILLDDCAHYDEALTYLQQLPRQLAAKALQKHGKALVTNCPEASTALLMQLCTMGDMSKPDGTWFAPVSDFAHLFTDTPMALMLLCEFILNSSPNPPGEQMLYHTLLDLYLSDDVGKDATNEAPNGRQAQQAQQKAASKARRRESALELLRRGWPSGGTPTYDPEHALTLCKMHDFQEGLVQLYENMRLFREVLRVYIAAGNHRGLIDAAVRLGDSSRGGDPQLWTEVLQYFGGKNQDCAAEILEVLAHIEASNVVPPVCVLQSLARNPTVKLQLVKDYITRLLQSESAAIEEDRRQIAAYQAETAAMQAELHELKTKAKVFQNSKCALSGAPLELPAVHFLCGHSFNLRALPDPEGRECPLCATNFRTIMDIRKSMLAGPTEQDKFFTQLKTSADGFSVVADFFGRGLLNQTSMAAKVANEH